MEEIARQIVKQTEKNEQFEKKLVELNELMFNDIKKCLICYKEFLEKFEEEVIMEEKCKKSEETDEISMYSYYKKSVILRSMTRNYDGLVEIDEEYDNIKSLEEEIHSKTLCEKRLYISEGLCEKNDILRKKTSINEKIIRINELFERINTRENFINIDRKFIIRDKNKYFKMILKKIFDSEKSNNYF